MSDPRAISSEVLLLCAALNEPDVVRRLELSGEHFVDRRLGSLYTTIQRALTQRKPTSVPVLAAGAGLAEHDVLRLRAKWVQLGVCVSDAPTYASDIRQRHRMRQAIAICKRVMETPEDAPNSAQVVAEAKAAFDAIDAGHERWRWASDCIEEFESELQVAQKDPDSIRRSWIATGFEKLDAHLHGGLRAGQLHVLAGQTSAGKSSFALALAANAAAAGVTCAICSFEDESRHVIERLIARASDRVLREVQRREVNAYAVRGALTDLKKQRIAICDALPRTLEELHWELVRFCDRERVRLVIVDYLQIARHIARRERSDYERINAIVHSVWRIARDTGAAVILVSQYNRQDELSGSSEIKQKAFSVLELRYRARKDDKGEIPIVEVDVTKHKTGPTGNVWIWFDRERVAFRDAPGEMLSRYYDVTKK